MPEKINDSAVRSLHDRIVELLQSTEKGSLAEYGKFLNNPTRVVWINFLGGLGRGFGIGIGFTLVAALFIYLLGRLAALNLPIIGQFIADITSIVQTQIKMRGF